MQPNPDKPKNCRKDTKAPGIYFVLTILVLAIGLAPYYLLVCEQPAKSDAVVMFVGPVKTERMSRAEQIIKDGLSQYLLIPAYFRFLKVSANGDFEPIRVQNQPSADKKHLDAGNRIAWRIENTHREALLARKMMDQLDLTSANFVSSPYHLRRIKIIAGRVFDDDRYQITFVAAGKPEGKPYLWWLCKDGWWWVTREYAKIIWFFVYEPFGEKS